jgi:ubiquinone/menaquinone biosynthesis C-methylase UbiE
MSFDVLAPHYRWMETVLAGSKLQRCRVAFLPEIQPPHQVLMLGEGAGRCLIVLAARFPDAEFTCIEASSGMIKQMRRALGRRGLDNSRIEWIHADARAWKLPEARFDLIVSHFFLDCFPADEIAALALRLRTAATEDASWLVADFSQPAGMVKRWRATAILWLMYRFFRVATRLEARELTPPDRFLEQAGFRLHGRHVFEWGLLHSDWWTRANQNVVNCPSRQGFGPVPFSGVCPVASSCGIG